MAGKHEHAASFDPETGHRHGCVCTPCNAHAAGMTVEEYRSFVRSTRTPEYQAAAWDRLGRSVYDSATVEPAPQPTWERGGRPHPGQYSRPAAPATSTWRKIEGEWAVRVPGADAEPGATVTVTKKDGSTADVALGDVLVRDADATYFRPAPHAARPVAPTVTVPEGRYATPSRTGNNDLDFWKVEQGEGRWAGFTFVRRIIGGSDGAQRIHRTEQRLALEAIERYGVEAAGMLYAEESSRCRRCGRVLTVDVSRHQGYGPECIKHVGG